MSKRILPITPWSNTSHWALNFKPLVMLCVSLALFGFGEALLLKSQLGSAPWTVFAQGLAVQTGFNIGLLTFITSCGVLALWLPLKQKFGLGTVLNICIIALSLGLFDGWLPEVDALVWQIVFAILGVVIVGVASSLYLTSHMGAGPRDGLMVGLTQLTGWPVGVVRSLIEGSVCLVGWLLGGVVGLATLLFTFGVGWVVQVSLDMLFKIYSQSFAIK
ncbi:MAG: membrane protein YczE [Moraxella sp.]